MSEGNGSAHWLEQINQWMTNGGWPLEGVLADLTYRAPRTPCPYCSTEGTTSPMEVLALTVTGGEAGVVWHMICTRGHWHSYPACVEEGS